MQKDHCLGTWLTEIICTWLSFNFFLIAYSLSFITALVASSITNVLKPYFLASRAVQPTQKSRASPQTQTYCMSELSSRFFSSLPFLSQAKPLQESAWTSVPLLMMISVGCTCRQGDSCAPKLSATQCSGHSSCTFPPTQTELKGCFWWVEAKETWWGGCQSLVSTTCLNTCLYCLRALMWGKIQLLWGTARAPPSQKSFWTSTMIRTLAIQILYCSIVFCYLNSRLFNSGEDRVANNPTPAQPEIRDGPSTSAQ